MPSMKQKTDIILNDKRNSNEILEILLKLKDDEDNTKTKPIQSLCKIFKTYLNEKAMYVKNKFNPEDKKNDNNSIYRNWLMLRYHEAFEGISNLMLSEDPAISELSLKSVRKLLIAESLHPLRPYENIGEAFPLATFRILLDVLLSTSMNTTPIIEQVSEIFLFDDVRHFTMKIIHSNITKYLNKPSVPPFFLTNTLAILHLLTIEGSEVQDFNTMVKCKETSNKILLPSNQKRVFTELWMDFLKLKISTAFYKTVLVSLHERVMPYFTSPLVLSDFLTTSYDIGGSISVLALNAIFILINKYNLNYPDFYQKLYKLLEPTVLRAKYKSRFFYLCDLFLTSTHLPCYLVAAFIKRLSTLALMADPSTSMLLLSFIYNLIRRHPNTAILLDRNEPQSVESDAYLTDEDDPSKCNAMQSSLWEIKTLQTHYYHPVQHEALKINSQLHNEETDICNLLDDDYDTLFKSVTEKAYKTAPMTYKVSENLFDIDSEYLIIE